jgi:ElaA protein
MKIFVKNFDELTLDELHDLLQLRSQIFVVEQDCVYQDIDGKDIQALHVFGKKDGNIVAYTRCFQSGIYFKEASIGRVAVLEDRRKQNYGNIIMKHSIKAIEKHYHTKVIKLSAQTYLVKFYESHGFIREGEEYLEDGIPHVAMIRAGEL